MRRPPGASQSLRAAAKPGRDERAAARGRPLVILHSPTSCPYVREDASSDEMSTVNTRRSSFWGIANPAPPSSLPYEREPLAVALASAPSSISQAHFVNELEDGLRRSIYGDIL